MESECDRAGVKRAIFALRAGLAYLAIVLGLTGAWALLFPSHFWENFPGFGLRFVEPLPAYNEHLLNDFGGLYLAFAVLFLVALLRPAPILVRALLGAFLIYALPHLLFHAQHLEPFGSFESAALMALVGSLVALPALLLFIQLRIEHRGEAGMTGAGEGQRAPDRASRLP